MAQLEETFNAPVIEAYGMTEAAHQMCSNPLRPGSQKPGAVGLPAGPEVRIADETEPKLADGGVGVGLALAEVEHLGQRQLGRGQVVLRVLLRDVAVHPLPVEHLEHALQPADAALDRDEVEIRYPYKVLFFVDSPPQADSATSGMTDLRLAL